MSMLPPPMVGGTELTWLEVSSAIPIIPRKGVRPNVAEPGPGSTPRYSPRRFPTGPADGLLVAFASIG